jgi:hypothetical protein
MAASTTTTTTVATTTTTTTVATTTTTTITTAVATEAVRLQPESDISHRVLMTEAPVRVREDRYRDNTILPEGLNPEKEEGQIVNENHSMENGPGTYPI